MAGDVRRFCLRRRVSTGGETLECRCAITVTLREIHACAECTAVGVDAIPLHSAQSNWAQAQAQDPATSLVYDRPLHGHRKPSALDARQRTPTSVRHQCSPVPYNGVDPQRVCHAEDSAPTWHLRDGATTPQIPTRKPGKVLRPKRTRLPLPTRRPSVVTPTSTRKRGVFQMAHSVGWSLHRATKPPQ